MWRRLREDRNQHYKNLDCPCWHDPKAMARFKEQPKLCSCWMCANRRRYDGDTLAERRVEHVGFNDRGQGSLLCREASAKELLDTLSAPGANVVGARECPVLAR